MELDTTTVFLTVLRESVSLFILLVFLFFSYSILNKVLKLFEDFGERLVQSLEDIANAMK